MIKPDILIDPNHTIDWKKCTFLSFIDPMRNLKNYTSFSIDFSYCSGIPNLIFSSEKDSKLFKTYFTITYNHPKINIELITNKNISKVFAFTLKFNHVTRQYFHLPIRIKMFSNFHRIEGTSEIILYQPMGSRRYEKDQLFDILTQKITKSQFNDSMVTKVHELYFYNSDKYIHIYKILSSNYFNEMMKKFGDNKDSKIIDDSYLHFTVLSEPYTMYYGTKGYYVEYLENEPIRLTKTYIESENIVKHYSVWVVNSKVYFVFGIRYNKNVYLANEKTGSIDRITNNDFITLNVNWYISNTNRLLISKTKIDDDYNKRYLNCSLDRYKEYEFSFSSPSEFEIIKYKSNVFFNSDNKPCSYIRNIENSVYQERNLLMDVGYTKTWFLCTLLLSEK